MKVCPHCGTSLPVVKLLGLSASRPNVCGQCKKLIANTWRGELSTYAVTGAGIWAGAWLLVPRGVPLLALMALALLLWISSSLLLASPVAYVAKPKLCAGCGRLDVGYRRPWDSVCIECHRKRQSPSP
jgi:hypothetical protein